MLRTIIKLPDGTEISSGANHRNAIQSVTLTECVNSAEDLILGSTCSNALEVTLITPEGGLSLEAGTEVIVYKEDGTSRKDVGVFVLEKPTRPTAHTMKVTGYDRVSKLDKDLSAWLSGLKEWPYPLTTFAGMVCEACGLEYKPSAVINGDFPVQQFTRSTVTGRQIMQWLGEICARFCRATPDGRIEFAWYTDSGKAITTGGEIYYFQNGLSYEDYETAKVDAVQLRLANSNDGALWPEAVGAVNSYIITGNAILNLQITESLRPVLANIQAAIADVSYTPCKVSIPANMDIRAGNTVRITDKNGKSITAYVMTKTQSGQKDTLECTGNRMRNTTAAVNNKTAAERAAEANGYADAAAKNAAQSAVDKQTQEDIFNKLTNNGQIQGIYIKDGKWYINAELAQILNLIVKSAQIESLEAGKITGLIDSDRIDVEELFAKSITMSGKFESTVEAFLPPTYDDAVYLLRAVTFPDKYPLPEGYDFDLNGDGVFDEDDAIAAIKVYNGELSMSSLPGAAKTTATLRINMSDPEKTIHIFGTNMWGTYVETFIGADVNNSSFASREYLQRMINQEPKTDQLYRTVDGEKEYFNPPMNVGVEYRTTERYMGKAVYVQLVSFGALPDATQANKNVYYDGENGAANIHHSDIIDITGRAYMGYNEATGEWSAFPFVYGGKDLGADIWYDRELGIVARTQFNLSNQLAWFTVKYTKNRA